MTVFDTLEIPLSPSVSFSKAVTEVIDELRAPQPSIPFQRNRHFNAVVDLREIKGIDAIVSFVSRTKGGHKIQLIEAGRKCQGEIADTVAACINDHPELQSVSRVDACANFADGPTIADVARATRVKSAQWQAEFGTVEMRDTGNKKMMWSEMGKRRLGTIYWGKQPNCVRAYDKLGERRVAYAKERRQHYREAFDVIANRVVTFPMNFGEMPRQMKRGFEKLWRERPGEGPGGGVPFPEFDEWFAMQCTGPMEGLVKRMRGQGELPGFGTVEQMEMAITVPQVLTRIERQMGAGRVPPQLDTFEKLFANAKDFNPFERIEFVFTDDSEIRDGEFSPRDVLAGLMMRQLLSGQVFECPCCNERSVVPPEMSYQQLIAFLNSKQNFKSKQVEKFAPFLQGYKSRAITAAELFENYRETITRQLAA